MDVVVGWTAASVIWALGYVTGVLMARRNHV
jgi:hypothetical protein